MISPTDIKQKKFSKSFGNYKSSEVDIFLKLVADDMAELLNEIQSLKEDLVTKERRMEEYMKMEKVLKESLVVAKITGEEIKNQSRKEAELIIKEAKIGVSTVLQEKEQEIKEKKDTLKAIEQRIKASKEQMKQMLMTQIKLIDEEFKL